MHFFVELYEVTAGAEINSSARFAQITVSPEPGGTVYFAVGSRLAVTLRKATLISLQVARDGGTGLGMSVNFSTRVSLGYLPHTSVVCSNSCKQRIGSPHSEAAARTHVVLRAWGFTLQGAQWFAHHPSTFVFPNLGPVSCVFICLTYPRGYEKVQNHMWCFPFG